MNDDPVFLSQVELQRLQFDKFMSLHPKIIKFDSLSALDYRSPKYNTIVANIADRECVEKVLAITYIREQFGRIHPTISVDIPRSISQVSNQLKNKGWSYVHLSDCYVTGGGLWSLTHLWFSDFFLSDMTIHHEEDYNLLETSDQNVYLMYRINSTFTDEIISFLKLKYYNSDKAFWYKQKDKSYWWDSRE